MTRQCLASAGWVVFLLRDHVRVAVVRSPICFLNEPLRVNKDRLRDFGFLRIKASGGPDQLLLFGNSHACPVARSKIAAAFEHVTKVA